ncbi:MAG: HAD family hydrolase [Nitrospirales bacterium]
MLAFTPTADAATLPPARIGAFFDVDNTLISGPAIELRFYRYLWTLDLVGWPETLRSVGVLLRSGPALSWQVLRERKPYLAGKDPATIEPVADAFVRTQICPHLSRRGLDRLEAHRCAGHTLVLVTASLDFLIAPLAAFLNIATVLAATPERTDRGYTGRLLAPFPYGHGKRQVLERCAARQGLILEHSYAYGDSPGDLEVLRLVGYPLVVNPIRGMSRIARQHKWPVARWT